MSFVPDPVRAGGSPPPHVFSCPELVNAGDDVAHPPHQVRPPGGWPGHRRGFVWVNRGVGGVGVVKEVGGLICSPRGTRPNLYFIDHHDPQGVRRAPGAEPFNEGNGTGAPAHNNEVMGSHNGSTLLKFANGGGSDVYRG